MAKVIIVIDSSTVDDIYARYHGKAVDTTLDTRFWETQPDKVIGISATSFHHEQTIELKAGRHTVEYAVSAYVGSWDTKITVNGKEIASGPVTVNQHLTGSFLLGPGFILPILVPLQTPLLKMKLLTFPPILKRLLG